MKKRNRKRGKKGKTEEIMEQKIDVTAEINRMKAEIRDKIANEILPKIEQIKKDFEKVQQSNGMPPTLTQPLNNGTHPRDLFYSLKTHHLPQNLEQLTMASVQLTPLSTVEYQQHKANQMRSFLESSAPTNVRRDRRRERRLIENSQNMQTPKSYNNSNVYSQRNVVPSVNGKYFKIELFDIFTNFSHF